jgi:ABC-type bacteriocin/lantibiotic exporter with double-glycine peptidase domain
VRPRMPYPTVKFKDHNRWRLLHFLAILAMIPFRSSIAVGALVEDRPETFCGARCVHHILELCGKQEDLVQLIQEINGLGLSDFVPFPALQRALSSRGIHTQFVEIGRLGILSSSQPAIIHIDGNHYVVLEESNESTAVLWDGVSGRTNVAWLSLRPRISAICLIASAQPIESGSSTSSAYRWLVAGIGASIAILGLYSCARLRKRYASSPGEPH